MKLKLEDIVNSIRGFQSLMKLMLPAKQSYFIAKLARKVEKEVKFYEAEKNKMFDLWSSESEGIKTIKPEFVKEYESKTKELNDTEIELDVKKIPIEWLMNSNELKPSDFIALEPFLEGEIE